MKFVVLYVPLYKWTVAEDKIGLGSLRHLVLLF